MVMQFKPGNICEEIKRKVWKLVCLGLKNSHRKERKFIINKDDIARLKWIILQQPMCDPVLVPLMFHPFHSLRKELPDHHPTDDEAAKCVLQEWLPDADLSAYVGIANIYSSALKIEETRSSETSVYFQLTTRHYIS